LASGGGGVCWGGPGALLTPGEAWGEEAAAEALGGVLGCPPQATERGGSGGHTTPLPPHPGGHSRGLGGEENSEAAALDAERAGVTQLLRGQASSLPPFCARQSPGCAR